MFSISCFQVDRHFLVINLKATLPKGHFDTLVFCAFYLKDEEQSTFYEEEPRTYRNLLQPLYIRLITIFVYTEVVVRTIDSTTSYSAYGVANRAARVDLLPMLTGIRVWRIVQLLTAASTYLYQLFRPQD